MVKVEKKVDKKETDAPEQYMEDNKPFSKEALQDAWTEFAESRKIYQAEYHLLTQPFDLNQHDIIIHLHNPIEETLLNNFKSDLTTFIRTKLKNNLITVTGELKLEGTKKTIYTNREKFDYMVQKNPVLKDLKDRLGLDTDF